MVGIEVVFWTCFLLVAHTYLLYPVSLFVASAAVQTIRDWRYLMSRQDRRRIPRDPVELPAVSFIIPAHNEERHLPEKLENLAELDYPKELLEVVFVSDGATDRTNEILATAERGNVRVVYLPIRGGKASAVNQGVQQARHELLVLSDAATLFAADAIRKLVRHFANSQVGVVCGALQFLGSVESRQTEGVYWRYEGMLRLMESRLGVTLTASGAIYAVRRECFVALPADTLVEDLMVPMNARKQGYRVLYDPEARATDFAPATVGGEFARRVRIATGSFRALGQLLRGPLDPLTGFAFFSHKLLRWILPLLLIGMLLASALLADHHAVYRMMFLAQGVFYLWAVVGYLFRRQVGGIRYALIPYYLLAMHLAFLVGLVRVLSRRGEVGWRRAG
jgi:cellulose synthase/poly-beta-1,6-N-acetylglucosamine synthase-like glycosyltransferase